MHSPPVWQALPEGLKVTMIVPNPLGVSPQSQCRVVEEGYTCISITTCPYFNNSYVFVTLTGCVLYVIIPACVEICVFAFHFECFYIVLD